MGRGGAEVAVRVCVYRFAPGCCHTCFPGGCCDGGHVLLVGGYKFGLDYVSEVGGKLLVAMSLGDAWGISRIIPGYNNALL